MTTCWMALDDTAADTGTIYHARGSRCWPHAPLDGTFHDPEDWLAPARAAAPAGQELELPAHVHPIYSRFRRPGESELDEAFFPTLWRGGTARPG